MGGLLGWLSGARQARADAHHLRELYGDQAKAWCEGMLAALPAGDARRRSILKIVRALEAAPISAISRRPAVHAPGAKPVAAADKACERSGQRKRPNWA